MRRKIITGIALTVWLIAVAMVTVAWAQDDLLAQSDAAYASRDGSGNKAKQALALAEQAFAQNASYDAAWRASRACFWVGDRTENRKIDAEYGKKGIEWGEKAKQLNPAGVEGHYFTTLGLGEYGKGIGVARALFKGVGGDFEKNCAKAIELNAGYDRGGPLRALGRYWQMLPAIKRDLKKAEQYYLKSKAKAPCMTRTYFYLTELYIGQKAWDKARAIAAEGEAVACPDFPWESAFYKKEIQKIKGKIPPQ
jgi:hypothetical protein